MDQRQHVGKPHGPEPIGVNRPLSMDRIPLVKVVNGDSLKITARLRDPMDGSPATPGSTIVKFVLSENRFSPSLYEGGWKECVFGSPDVPGLVEVRVPPSVTSTLRRGIYAFSLQVSSALGNIAETQAYGHVQVDYEPSSPLHDIPYRQG